ncbi:MAG: serine hydrolase domain-containing protein [Blastocatellia bacterium]
MRRSILAMALVAQLVIPLPRVEGQATRRRVVVPADGVSTERLAKLGVRMRGFVDRDRAAGIVTLVAHRGKVVHQQAVGWQDLDSRRPVEMGTLFHIASMTKPITALAIMMLVEDGLVALSDPVARHLPAFSGLKLRVKAAEAVAGSSLEEIRPPARAVTIRDLLTHTSGMRGGYPESMKDLFMTRNLSLAEAVEAFAKEPLESEPGGRWGYSNMGIATLGRIVEVVSGQPFEVYLAEKIFNPLAMNDTHLFLPAEKAERIASIYRLEPGRLVRDQRYDRRPQARYSMPEGGLYSTAPDLFRLYQMMLNGGELEGRRILSRAAVEVMTRVHTGELKAGFSPGVGFGLGWAVVRETEGMFRLNSVGTFGHGGLFKTYGFIDPAKQLVGIILMQRLSDDGDMGEEFNAFMAMSAAAVN